MGSEQWVAVRMGADWSFLVRDTGMKDRGEAKGGRLKLRVLGAVREKPRNNMRK